MQGKLLPSLYDKNEAMTQLLNQKEFIKVQLQQ